MESDDGLGQRRQADEEMVDRLRQRVEELRAEFEAACDADKVEVMRRWKRAVDQFADAVLRGNLPVDAGE